MKTQNDEINQNVLGAKFKNRGVLDMFLKETEIYLSH